MATTLTTSEIPESFKGLLSNVKVVQDAIEETIENMVSLLEGRNRVVLYPDNPSLSNGVDISSANNFMALSESYFIVKIRYEVKDNITNAQNRGNYSNWICPTSPAFSWVKNIRVEFNGQEVTQSGQVADMQIVNHILSLLESSIGKLQYTDSDLFGLQKLDPKKALKAVPLQTYSYGTDRRVGWAFETNVAGANAANPDFAADHTLKREPTVQLSSTKMFSNTVQENIVRVLSGNFQFKFRPFIPFFNAGDSWLPPGTQVKLRVDLPQGDLSRYMIISNRGGGANNAATVSSARVELKELDFVYPTYRMKKDYGSQVSIAKELYFNTWCPRLIQKQINDDAGSLELLHNAPIPRKMVLFFTDSRLGDAPDLRVDQNTDSSNRLAMIHANLSQLRVIVNEQSLFDHPLKFSWQCSEGESNQAGATYFYDPNKSSYLRGYNLVQEFLGKSYGTEVPVTAEDYCNNWFMIPINLNLDHYTDSAKARGNLSIDYQFSNVANSPIALPSDQNTSIRVNLLCLDQYLYTMSKEKGITWATV